MPPRLDASAPRPAARPVPVAGSGKLQTGATRPAYTAARKARQGAARAAWAFALLLALALAGLFLARPPAFGGDVLEYTVGTVAVAAHGTPDIRATDIDRTIALLPGRYDEVFRMLQREITGGVQDVFPAFARGRDGHVYPIHFFGYPMMAALPFRALEAFGQPPFKAYQAVNLAFIFVLGLCLLRFFGSARRAAVGVLLFMLCGGALYWNWTSPECVGAAALLSSLLLFTSGMPVAGSLLAGLAAQQNPTIVFFFAFAPLIRYALEANRNLGFKANLRAQFTGRTVFALAAGVAVAALPLLFNLHQYGVPNLIASRFSDPALVDGTRLLSFFFDLNQGMVIGIPGVLAALLLVRARRDLRLLALCGLFTLALVLPALAVLNWNSGAVGPMRYAFWAAMPLLFAFLALLRSLPRWRMAALGAVLALQGAAMAHATRYDYVAFSPLAKLVLEHAPQYYHPEPEIFAERMAGNDNWVEPGTVYTWRVDGVRRKTLVHASDKDAAAELCGPKATLAPDNAVTDSARGWRYIDGPVRCSVDGSIRHTWLLDDIVARGPVVLGAGWSGPETNGQWRGIWSDGARSRLTVRPGIRPDALVLRGAYLEGNARTRVIVNGIDLGWHALDQARPIALPAAAQRTPLHIELEHEAPRSPHPGEARQLAVFLQEVSLRLPNGRTP